MCTEFESIISWNSVSVLIPVPTPVNRINTWEWIELINRWKWTELGTYYFTAGCLDKVLLNSILKQSSTFSVFKADMPATQLGI